MNRERELRRNLWACCADGGAFSVMVGIGETYVPAFVLALGLGQVSAALVATLPILAGGVLQMFAPRILHRLRSPGVGSSGRPSFKDWRWLPWRSSRSGEPRPLGSSFCVSPFTGRLAYPAGQPGISGLSDFSLVRSAPVSFRGSRWNQVALLGGLVAGGLVLRYADSIDAAGATSGEVPQAVLTALLGCSASPSPVAYSRPGSWLSKRRRRPPN
ncbi:MAG: hypothetical protein R3B96_07835 [Pirellulaceae bacterium]